MNGMHRVSHAVGGGSNPEEGWDTPGGEAALPFYVCGASKLTSSVWYSGQGVVRWPECATFDSGGLEMRRFRVMINEYLPNI